MELYLVGPVDSKYHMMETGYAPTAEAELKGRQKAMTTMPRSRQPTENPPARSKGLLIFAWLFVGIPLAWGVVQTVIKSMALFH